MQEEPLSLNHKSILSEGLRTSGSSLSEYSFANLYLFREKHAYSVLIDEVPFIRGKAYSGREYVMPTRDVRKINKAALDRMIDRYGCLFPIPEIWLTDFPGSEYAVSHDDTESDYLHLINKLVAYSGRKLHSKRNLLLQFTKRYSCEALPLTNDRLADARTALDAWNKTSDLPPEATDYGACNEAISLYEELGLCGGIYYIDGQPAGFIMGEELDATTFVIHFAKADHRFKGIYQFMYQQFAGIMPSKYALFNFEQDLGLESLRQAKASYHPDKMAVKYRVERHQKVK
ncbi:MAG: phosphatidylglycerol lysyltransferase domain-containing protein [Chitinispirillaceae bacterium]|jgi:hypothetical protein